MWYKNNKLHHLNDFDNLPIKCNRAYYLTRKYQNMYNLHKFDCPRWKKDPEHSPWKICNRIIKNNIGKSFSLAFSYYCKQVPQYYQYIFLEEFINKRIRFGIDFNEYLIDNDGLIQLNPNYYFILKRSNKYTKGEKKTSEYQKYIQEKLSKQRKLYRENERKQKEIEYCFLTKDEINNKKESIVKLISHGFDPITSFRNH